MKQAMRPFWLISWAFALAAGWLLPNHQMPWTSFHIDAWIAALLALASLAVMSRCNGPVRWHDVALVTAAMVLMPILQYAFGLILLPGTAWINSAYLLGLLLALITGSQWEIAQPGKLADGLFLAIGLATIASVGLQLLQWLGLDAMSAWSMGDGNGRPFANLGQPNQLSTFLLWGLLAGAWGLLRRHIGVGTALLLALYLLFGLALTQSRTAWVAVALLVLAGWHWRRLWNDPRSPWLVCALGLYFAACVFSLGFLNQGLLLNTPPDTGNMSRISSELRPAIWSIFVDAALQRPLAGYGWGQVGLAHLNTALNHPPLEMLHAHSHSLLLDLVLWCGIPVGLLLSLYLLRWLWLRLLAVNSAEDAVLMLFLLVIGNHAMLELPLHYAYFLLPVGLVMGTLNARLHVKPILLTGRWSLVSLCLASIAVLTLIVSDYFKVETSYQELRYEQAHIKTEIPGRPPEVFLLSQFREFIHMARFEPGRAMSTEDLDWMRKVSSSYPGAATIPKLALALALNKQALEAQQWLEKMCRIESRSRCEAVKQVWANQLTKYPEIAAVHWPDSTDAATLP
ncbi:MAG: Wzy polymerase domain-containing protein [Rhodoferax sp.]